MPEGPSIVILREQLLPYKGRIIRTVKGNAKIEKELLVNKKILDLRTWGKQFFICLKGVNVRVHFLLFGTFSLDVQTKPDKSLRLGLLFSKGAIYFYTCSVRLIPGPLDGQYEWEADVLSDKWDSSKARKKLVQIPGVMVCDALLDQNIFSGVGNIIKNEVLYRTRIHPETFIKYIPPRKTTELVKEARNYSFDFLKWKREFVLKKHWLAHTKKICQRCQLPFVKKNTGKKHRRSFFCENCQVKYE